MQCLRLLPITLSILFASPCAYAAEIGGQVIAVVDGDTIDILHHNRANRIRLHGIDCPEKGQPHGKRAKQAVSALVFAKEVIVQTHGLDKYGRTIGDVLLSDGRILNHELVKDGWCWWYRKYAPNDTELEKLESEARQARKGLWNDPAPIPPWNYRKMRQNKEKNSGRNSAR